MKLLQPLTPKMMVLDNSLAIAPCTKSFVNSMGWQFPMFFFPTQRDQSSWVGRRRHDDGMSWGVGTWEECWKKEKNERPSWNVHFIGMCKEKNLPAKNSLGHILGSGSSWKLQSGELTKENRRIRFISPHHRVSLQNSNLFLKLAKKNEN